MDSENENASKIEDFSEEKSVDILAWIKRCIEGSSGLYSYENYEWAIRTESDEITGASWIIKCLANPNNKGSEDVLQAIIEHRRERV
jgi:hypothetical protein